MLRQKQIYWIFVIITAGLLAGCGGDTVINSNIDTPALNAGPSMPAGTWPDALPVDTLQPWEQLDESGKLATGINAASEFRPGVERFSESPAYVSDNGEASHVASGAASAGETGWAIYRLEMGGEQPGVVSTDVNLGEMPGGGISSYYIGLGNYGAGAWDWHGPFTDSHVRLSVGADVISGGNYLSGLGNHFVSIVAHDGAVFDVVAVGANPVAAGDTTAPDAPVLDSLTPVAGGLEIEWLHGGAADLAGFRIYHAPHFFADSSTAGVTDTGYLMGGNRHLLEVASQTYIRVAAIDINGNESALSDIMNAAPLPGGPPDLILITDAVGGLIGTGMNLNASGCDSYDWDLDGDGVFEITADAAGAQAVTPGSVGIIRPAVRGTTGGGDSVACGSVSLVISGNARPIAQGFADPASGYPPLAVTFTSLSSDFDGAVVKWAWDFNGDKLYDFVTEDPAGKNPPPYNYTTPGVYNAKFRAWDNDGAWDVDTVTIVVHDDGSGNNPPTAVLGASAVNGPVPHSVTFDASMSTETDPGDHIVRYWWDLDGDTMFEGVTVTASYTHTYTMPGMYNAAVMVEDTHSAVNIITVGITAQGWVESTLDYTSDPDDRMAIAVINGNPAIVYVNDLEDFVLYTRASDPQGTSWNDPVKIYDSSTGVSYVSLAVVDGQPAVTYRRYITPGNYLLEYARANDVNGDSWGAPVAAHIGGAVGAHNSLAVVEGHPAISYAEASPNYDLLYVRATNSTGSSWGAPVTVYSTNNVGNYSRLAVANGNPAISFYDQTNTDLLFVQASDTTGSAWNAPVVVFGSGGSDHSLAIIEGRPAICYADSSADALKYTRADDANGSAWTTHVIAAAADIYECSLTIVNGNPAIAFEYDEYGYLGYVEATDTLGSSWGSAQVVDPTSWCAEYVSAAGLATGCGIAYTREVDDSEGDYMTLKYAYNVE